MNTPEIITRRPTLFEMVNQFADSYGRTDPAYQRFISYQPIPKLMPYFASAKRTKAIIGANKSTKTTAAIWEDIMIFTGIIPPALRDIYPHKLPLNRTRIVRIVVMNYSKHWPETIKPMLVGEKEGMLPKLWANWDEATHIFTGPDGSMLSVMSIDPKEKIDPNILRGPGIDHTHCDEMTSQEVYEESLTRAAALRDGPADVSLTFCPQDGFNWTYTDLLLATHDSATEEALPEEKTHPDIFCIYGLSMDDNPSISADRRESIKRRLKPHQLSYRYYGKYSLRGDNSYFNVAILEGWYKRGWCGREPLRVVVEEDSVNINDGVFTGKLREAHPAADPERDNIWLVWALPENGHKYVMALDSSEGNRQSDYNVCDIYDATDINHVLQCAQFRKRLIKPGDFTVQALCMANVYGDCLFVPECNNTSGGAVVDRAREYPNIYQRITTGNVEEKETIKLGWFTNFATKPAMLEDTYELLFDMYERDGYCPFRSRMTLNEFMNYQERVERDADNKTKTSWGAKIGGHDDCVAAACIAFRVIRHEHQLLTPARLPGIVAPQNEYQSPLESQINEEKREIAKHPQPSLKQLRLAAERRR